MLQFALLASGVIAAPAAALLASGVIAAPAADRLAEAHHAIEAGRLEQARAMLAGEMAKGVKGARIDRALADLAFASGKHAEAFARYAALLTGGATDSAILERGAISAARSGNLKMASNFADRAVATPSASWKVWNVRGVIADLHNDFAKSDESYERALSAAPGQAMVLNNMGWSRLLRGQWEAAAAYLDQAVAAKDPPARASNNLELARAALESNLPRRREKESDTDFAARLNDAGVAARIRGERKRAIAAFAQAIEARGAWYRRAAHNLRQAEVAQ